MSPKPFLTARWLDLAMVNYEADPTFLARKAPRGTEIDRFEGKAYVSLVGFRFCDTRVLGLALPGHRNFEEVNLRFYVRREAKGEVRRGVCFVKEIVPRPAVAWIARRIYNENYIALPMRHRVSGTEALYEWRLGERWNALHVQAEGPSNISTEGSFASFITEHYWGYVRQRDGSTVEYRVEHPKWSVRPAQYTVQCDFAALYGPEFAEILTKPALSAFLADGSAVIVRRGVPLDS